MLRKLNYIGAIAETLIQMMEKDKRIFLLGEGVDGITGIYGTILPAYKKFGERRIIDTPLSENGLTGIAIGAALDGMRPVLFHQRNDFMLLTMDQLVNTAAKIRYISAGEHRVPLTVISFIARKVGEGAQHSQSLQALFSHIPGLKVVMPTTPCDAKGLLVSAIEDDDPVIVLFHRALFDEEELVRESLYRIPIGRARIVKSGKDITVVTVSAAVKDAVLAEQSLSGKVDAEIIDLCSIRPFDKEAIRESVEKTGRLLVIDSGWKSFGVSAEVIASVVEESFHFLKTAPQRIAMLEVPAPASPYLLKNYHPNSQQISEAMLAIMEG